MRWFKALHEVVDYYHRSLDPPLAPFFGFAAVRTVGLKGE